MPSALSRGPVTSRLLNELEDVGFPVGDQGSPDIAFGWSGEPNEESTSFTPWMILTPLAGQPQRVPGAIGDTGTEWTLSYSVFYAGVSRRQAEALADKVRAAFVNIEREGVESPSGRWRIMKITCTAIGSTNRVGSAYPDYYTQIDTFEVWMSKER